MDWLASEGEGEGGESAHYNHRASGVVYLGSEISYLSFPLLHQREKERVTLVSPLH